MTSIKSKYAKQLDYMPCFTAGLVIGIIGITFAVSFATMMFSGVLKPYLPQGIGIMLFGATILSAGMAVTSTIPGLIAGPEEIAPAILTTVGVTVASQAQHADEAFSTFIIIIAATVILTGAILWLLGHFQLGRMVRFIPYPVIGGFLAGAGWLLVYGGITMMLDTSMDLKSFDLLFRPEVLSNWLPGLIFAIFIFALLKKYTHFLLLPGLLVGTAVVFYLVLWINKITIADATLRGWLLGALPSGGLWKPITLTTTASADLNLVLSQTPNILAIATLTVITLLLCITGIEIALNRETELNRELHSSGLVNIISGLCGGFSGCHIIGDTNLVYKMGANKRLTGLIVSAICLLTLFTGGKVLAYFPRCILGGILIYQGLFLLYEWLVSAARKLPRHDYAITLIILGVIIYFGFLEGLVVGITLTLIVFVFNYSRVEFIKLASTGCSHRSNVERLAEHNIILNSEGDHIYILVLRGYLFFGTADNLLEHIRNRINIPDRRPVKYLVIDFRQVTGIDSSATFSFTKLMRTAQTKGITLSFTRLSKNVTHLFKQHGFFEEFAASIHMDADLDHGLEWCENQLLLSKGIVLKTTAIPIREQLQEILGAIVNVNKFIQNMERIEIAPGNNLITQGTTSDEVYFVESGEVTTQLEMADGRTFRLRKMGPGAIIGEIGFYLHTVRTASVVSQTPCVVYRLSSQALDRITVKHPTAIAAFHNYMVKLQSERLVSMNKIVTELVGKQLKRPPGLNHQNQTSTT